MILDNLKSLVKEELKRALNEENEESSSIETLEDAINFLNNNKQHILHIADHYKGDVPKMQKAIDDSAIYEYYSISYNNGSNWSKNQFLTRWLPRPWKRRAMRFIRFLQHPAQGYRNCYMRWRS